MSTTPSAAFKALGDPIRLRLFYLLSLHAELCVCHLTDALQLPQSTVSRHLGVLRRAGLAIARRDGKWIYYRLNGELAAELAKLTSRMRDALMQQDARRLDEVVQRCS